MPRELGATRLQGLLEEAQDLSEEEREFEEKVTPKIIFELGSDLGFHLSVDFAIGIVQGTQNAWIQLYGPIGEDSNTKRGENRRD